MRILLSNDDGYLAPGIRRLETALSAVAQVFLVAPDRNRSGASNSLTLDRPLRVRRESDRVMCVVDGTPTDCVHLALTGLLQEQPDMVISGINAGANLGDDTLYSGTVAAAMEGRSLGYPAIAISSIAWRPQHLDTPVRVAMTLVEHLRKAPLPPDTILNVNVPDVPWEELRGFESTRLGQRHRAETVVRSQDPRGRTIYWIGPTGAELDAGPGTDFHAISEGKVSVTPILIDLTRHNSVGVVGDWLKGMQ
jgi:5'-nucleotidase